MDVYYSASDDPAQRRTVFLAALQRTFSGWGADWTLQQSFRLSDFREGASDGRTDVRAKTVFGPTWPIGYGASAGAQAVYMHNSPTATSTASTPSRLARPFASPAPLGDGRRAEFPPSPDGRSGRSGAHEHIAASDTARMRR